MDDKKQCTRCKEWFPATTKYFIPHLRHKDGLDDKCIACLVKHDKMITEAARARRRTNKRAAGGHYGKRDEERQYRSQKGKCWHCGEDLNGKYHRDHLVPLDRGGTNWPNNIVLACEYCNCSKGNKLCYEWNGKLF